MRGRCADGAAPAQVQPRESRCYRNVELMPMLGYATWDRFEDAVDRAKTAAENIGAGQQHFLAAEKSSPMPYGGSRSTRDWYLTRYGSYMVAMNGDPRKPVCAGRKVSGVAEPRTSGSQDGAPVVAS